MYTKPIDEIEFPDIEHFVAKRNRESIILDYKGDWPSDLAKTMAAMANTQGGLVLVGVKEEHHSGYPGEIVGVDIGGGEDRIGQKAGQIAYQAVYPPLMPEIRVCRLDTTGDRAVVVIRIAPSNRTPHATDNRRKVYVRVDSRSEPQELATLDQLNVLWAGRRKAEEAREALVANAVERSEWFLEHQSKRSNRDTRFEKWPFLRVWVVPSFFTGNEALSLEAVAELVTGYLRNRPVTDVQCPSGSITFPRDRGEARSIPMGYCIYSRELPPGEYVELSTSGLVFADVCPAWYDKQKGSLALNFALILASIDGLLKTAELAHRESQMWGLLRIEAVLHQVSGCRFEFARGTILQPSRDYRCPNQRLPLVKETVHKRALGNARPGIVNRAARSLLWSTGCSWDAEIFDRWFSQNTRYGALSE